MLASNSLPLDKKCTDYVAALGQNYPPNIVYYTEYKGSCATCGVYRHWQKNCTLRFVFQSLMSSNEFEHPSNTKCAKENK